MKEVIEVWKYMGKDTIKMYTDSGLMMGVLYVALTLVVIGVLVAFWYICLMDGNSTVRRVISTLLLILALQLIAHGVWVGDYKMSLIKEEALVKIQERTGNPDLVYIDEDGIYDSYIVGYGDEVYRVVLTGDIVEYSKIDNVINLQQPEK